MTIFLLLIVIALILGQDTDYPLTLGVILETYKNEFLGNVHFVAIQTILILVAIWFVGGLCGQLIIVKEKNRFIIGGLSIFLLWTSLFICSTLTAGIMNSIKYGVNGFESATVDWMIYGLIPFLCFGLLHGLIVGFTIGHEIKKRGGTKRPTIKAISHGGTLDD